METLVILLACNSLIIVINGEGARPMLVGQDARLARPKEFPYQVSIQINCRHDCGGSLISEKHVLTAAHCVSNFVNNPNRFSTHRLTVEVGSNQIGGGVTHDVKRVSHINSYNMYPESPYIFPNDVAVITLEQAITRSKSVDTIQIAREEPRDGERMIVSGFGQTRDGGQPSRALKKATMEKIPPNECNLYWNRLGKSTLQSQICANLKPGYGVCGGDSGGPLVIARPNGKYLVGIVSAGSTKCGDGYPDIYTKASAFLPYIEREMAHESTGQPVPEALAVDLQSPNGASPQTNPKCVPLQGDPETPPQFDGSSPPQFGGSLSPQFGGSLPPQFGGIPPAMMPGFPPNQFPQFGGFPQEIPSQGLPMPSYQIIG